LLLVNNYLTVEFLFHSTKGIWKLWFATGVTRQQTPDLVMAYCLIWFYCPRIDFFTSITIPDGDTLPSRILSAMSSFRHTRYSHVSNFVISILLKLIFEVC
jgi:hypothetical protein